MNSTFKYLLILFSAMIISCTEKEPTITINEGDGEPTSVEMSIDRILFDQSKATASAGDNGLSFKWSSGDKVGVYTTGSGFALYTLNGGAETTTGVFDGNGFALKEGSTYYAFYPYSADATSISSIPVDYTSQKITSSATPSYLGSFAFLSAKATANSKGAAQFKFSHLSSFARLSASTNSEVQFKNLDLIPETGSLVTGYSYNLSTCAISSEKTATLQTIAMDGFKSGKDAKAWVSFAPKNYSEQEIVTVFRNDSKIYSARIQGTDLKAGKAYRMNPVSTDMLQEFVVKDEPDFEVQQNAQVSLSSLGVAAGQYSAIVHLEGDRYAVVHDKAKGSGIYFFDLKFDTDGNVISASATLSDGSKNATDSRDPEGIAKVGDKFLVSGENDQAILEYDLNGNPTGKSITIPSDMDKSSIQSNLGFEALTTGYDKSGNQIIWTTTESSLSKDKDYKPVEGVGPLLRLQSFKASDYSISDRCLYLMDAPQMENSGGIYVHGVSSLLGLPDGRLVVLEREVGSTGTGYAKLYLVDPNNDPSGILSKTLIAQIKTGVSFVDGKVNVTLANYEGMCLGPTLSDGTTTILLINDSQGGQKVSTYKLDDYIKTIRIKL